MRFSEPAVNDIKEQVEFLQSTNESLLKNIDRRRQFISEQNHTETALLAMSNEAEELRTNLKILTSLEAIVEAIESGDARRAVFAIRAEMVNLSRIEDENKRVRFTSKVSWLITELVEVA